MRARTATAILALTLASTGCDQTQGTSAPSATAEPAATATTSAPPPTAAASETVAAPAETPAPSASAPSLASAAPAPANPATSAASKALAASAKTAVLAPSAAASATAAPAPERKVKTVGGSSHSADSFSLAIQAPSPVRAGETANAAVVLTAKPPYHCNAKYPYKMALDAPSGGVSYPSNPVRAMSVGEKTSTMSVPFTPSQKGKATVSGTLSFSVCTDDKCLIEKRPLSVTVDVD